MGWEQDKKCRTVLTVYRLGDLIPLRVFDLYESNDSLRVYDLVEDRRSKSRRPIGSFYESTIRRIVDRPSLLAEGIPSGLGKRRESPQKNLAAGARLCPLYPLKTCGYFPAGVTSARLNSGEGTPTDESMG